MAHARDAWADPQSGPSRQRVPGFFHFHLEWVYAEPGRITGLAVSNYIRRIDGPIGERDAAAPMHGEMAAENSLARVSDYVTRRGRAADGELGAHVLIGRGLPVRTGAQLARLLDARERKRDRTYRMYGGTLPRVASHLIASYPYGTTHEQADAVAHEFATVLSDRLRVPIEAQVHLKHGQPDHIHALIGTRIVENGKLGGKQRALDAVSEKAAGRKIAGTEHYIGATIEWMRGEWAARMRAISGDQTIDHRSYARRGIPLTPVMHVQRSEIWHQRRHKQKAWRERRRDELTARQPGTPDWTVSAAHEDDMALPPNPQTAHADAAMIRQRTEALADLVVVPARQGTAAGVGDSLAGLLGLDLPGAVVGELLRRHGASRPTTNQHAAHASRPGPEPPQHDNGAGSSPPRSFVLLDEGHIPSGIADKLPRDPRRAPSPDTVAPATASLGGQHGNEADGGGHRDLRHVTAMYLALRRAHRVTVARAEALAAAVGLERVAFEAAATAAGTTLDSSAPTLGGAVATSNLPPHLLVLWQGWADEDNEARRTRRARGADPVPLPPATGAAVGASGSPDATVGRGVIDGPVRDDNEARTTQSVGSGGAEHVGADRQPAPGRTRPGHVDTGEPQHTAHAGPDAMIRSDVITLELRDVFAADVFATARRYGAPAPSDAALERGIAVRLRATGRDRAEVAAMLASDTAGQGAQALAHAFSDATTQRLDAQPHFVRRIRVFERRTEARLYDQQRRKALRQLRDDLDAVWRERRMRADEAVQRHAHRIAFLRELTWRARRVRREDDLISAVLALAIEVGVLRPMIKAQHKRTAAERSAINEAAARASAELGRVRRQWHDHVRARKARATAGVSETMPATAHGKEVAADTASVVAAAGPSGSVIPPVRTEQTAPIVDGTPEPVVSDRQRPHPLMGTYRPVPSVTGDGDGTRQMDAERSPPTFRVLDEGHVGVHIRPPMPPAHQKPEPPRVSQGDRHDNTFDGSGQAGALEVAGKGERVRSVTTHSGQATRQTAPETATSETGKMDLAPVQVRHAGEAKQTANGRPQRATPDTGAPTSRLDGLGPDMVPGSRAISEAERAEPSSDDRSGVDQGRGALPRSPPRDPAPSLLEGRRISSSPVIHMHSEGAANARLDMRVPTMAQRSTPHTGLPGTATPHEPGPASARAKGKATGGSQRDARQQLPIVGEDQSAGGYETTPSLVPVAVITEGDGADHPVRVVGMDTASRSSNPEHRTTEGISPVDSLHPAATMPRSGFEGADTVHPVNRDASSTGSQAAKSLRTPPKRPNGRDGRS